MVIKEIIHFLKSFYNVISEEHKLQLLTIQSQLESVNNLKTKINKHGKHFEDCVWSNEDATCGPDTCHCSYLQNKKEQVEEEAKKIINFYYVLKCKNCTFNKI